MPSTAQLLPLLGEDYEWKYIELGIIRCVRNQNASRFNDALCSGLEGTPRFSQYNGSIPA
jgi:predicted ABC-class ATPase